MYVSRRDRAITIIKHWKSEPASISPAAQVIANGSSQIRGGDIGRAAAVVWARRTRLRDGNPPKQWDLGHLWDVVCLGVVGFRDRGIAKPPSAPRWFWLGLGRKRDLALAARAGASEIHAMIVDPVPQQATAWAPHGPSTDQNLPCHEESHVISAAPSLLESRSGSAVETYSCLISNGISQRRCISTMVHQGPKKTRRLTYSRVVIGSE